jgi:hypothetical protein
LELVELLRVVPNRGRLANAVEHMWGYVSASATAAERKQAEQSLGGLLRMTRELALRQPEPYLVASTALSELAVFADR